MAVAASTTSWSSADTALWCYLFLPVLVFIPGFFVPEIGIPAAAIAATAALHWLQGRKPARGGHNEQRRLLIDCALLTLLAGAWAALCGAGHLFHANGIDWVPRFAVLRDLVVEPWPPRYGEGSDMPMLLRAPVGYYLPTALIAHLTSLANADFMLLAWTWMGVALFFCANMGGTRGQKLTGALLFALASGLDVIGLLARTGSLPWPGQHIEWWAAKMQYSSNTTLLFWVPNHALPGWISAAWLWRFREDSRFLARLPILFLPVMVWSPLTALGLLPIACAAIAARWRAGLLARPERSAMLLSAVLMLVPGGLGAAYLLLGMGAGEPGLGAISTSPSAAPLTSLIADRTLFFVLEAGIFAAFALMLERSAPVIASVAVLAALPWLTFGPNNDLIMRASIPALTILWLRLIAELTAEAAEQSLSSYLRAALLALFLVGTVTPYQEIYRALNGNVWAADTGLSAPMALEGFPPHYFVAEKYNWLAPWMRR